MREQHDLAIGELNGIVVRTWVVQVDLPEPPNPVRDVPRFPLEKTQEKSGLLPLNFAIERDLSTRKKAHGHLGFSDCGESVCRGIPKLRRNQLFSDLGWSRRNFVQAVVAHGRGAPICQRPPSNLILYKKFTAKSWSTTGSAHEQSDQNSKSATCRDCGFQIVRACEFQDKPDKISI